MRGFAALFLLCAAGGLAAVDESSAVDRVRNQAEQVRALVEAGALPRARLEQVEREVADARDDDVLRRTLYGRVLVEDLTEDQIHDMTAAAERRVARQREKLEQAKKLVEAGVSPRTALSPLIEELDRRHRTVDLVASRANVFRELAEAVKREQALEASLETEPEAAPRIAERYDGAGAFRLAQLRSIMAEFQKEFRRALPVSAFGMTRLHQRLGFDHRERADVSLRPDQPEGVWLRRHLEALKIPYIAFRGFIPGVSTAPHIHIGPPSGRLRVAD